MQVEAVAPPRVDALARRGEGRMARADDRVAVQAHPLAQLGEHGLVARRDAPRPSGPTLSSMLPSIATESASIWASSTADF